MRRIVSWILPLFLMVAMFPAQRAAAQEPRCFSETGYCIEGAIRTYWERNGGLSVFGYPITSVQEATIEGTWTGPIQWFERDRLEDHSAQGLGVMAGRLGAQYLEYLGRPWTPGKPPSAPAPDCAVFRETGYQVCGPFLRYWQRNGGLERFGYPITGQFDEEISGRAYAVQYFERRRMELHPENAAPYNVLLGLLGRELSNVTCAVPVLWELYYSGYNPSVFGCPIPGQDYEDFAGARERFERGEMYWIQLRGGGATIYVVTYGQNNQLTYQRFPDTWSEGQSVSGGLKPPQGLVEPTRGFGKVWREQPGVREALGWALEPEQAAVITYQEFERGALMRVKSAQSYSERGWQFFPDGRAISVE